MIHKIEAVVLHARRYGDTSRIITLYSRDKGKVAAIARGASRPKSRLAYVLQPMSSISAVISVKEGRELHTLSSAETHHRFICLSESVDRISAGLAMIELVNAVTIDHDPNPPLYDMLVAGLAGLGNVALHVHGVHAWFLSRLPDVLGYGLQTAQCVVCREPFARMGSAIRFCLSLGGPVCSEHERSVPWIPVDNGAFATLHSILGSPTNQIWSRPVLPSCFAELHDLLLGFLRCHVDGMRWLRVGGVTVRLQTGANDVNEQSDETVDKA